MNSEHDPNQGGADKVDAGNAQNPVFYYKDSGINERHGRIPAWLMAVVAALFVWGVYYLVAFWSPPPG